MDAKVFKDLFCEWCPNDCRDRKKDPLTDEERAGCVASGGFADAVVEELGDRLVVLDEDQTLPKIHVGSWTSTDKGCLRLEGYEAAERRFTGEGFRRVSPLGEKDG